MSYVQIIIFFLSVITILPSFAHAVHFKGKVVEVIEGDIIKVLRDHKAVKIRLYGIDCPEKDQPYGKRARQFTSQRAYGEEVRVNIKAKDQHGLIVADVILPYEQNLSHELVGAGLAWWYRKHGQYDDILFDLEAEVKEAKRGLWADKAPIPPWEWRKSEHHDQTKTGPAPVAVIYKANATARIFHRPGCQYYDCKACTVTLKTKFEAIYSGYTPCNVCKP